MVMITSIRAPFPVAEVLVLPATIARPQAAAGSAPPVTATVLEQAVQHSAQRPPAAHPEFRAARTSVEDSAAIAAEAARKAYIKASIAAGISPLPLP